MSSDTIRVILVDDHAILRTGIKQILTDNIENVTVVAEADNAASAIKVSREVEADVMLLDISLPDRSGIDALKQIKADSPNLAVLMLSMYMEDQYAVRSLKSGASGYLCKHSASDDLLNAIEALAKGKKFITPEVAEILAGQLDGTADQAPHENLSDREFQTMILIASGFSVSEIAEQLTLSVKTISMYRSRLLQKMRFKHNADITHYAVKNHLV